MSVCERERAARSAVQPLLRISLANAARMRFAPGLKDFATGIVPAPPTQIFIVTNSSCQR